MESFLIVDDALNGVGLTEGWEEGWEEGSGVELAELLASKTGSW